MTVPNAQPRMEKTLGLWAVFSIATGAMISSGLFVLPGLAFRHSGPSMILAYAVAGLLNIPTMLAQAELVTAMPKSAGSYFVVERSLGAYIGTVAGLINWCAIGLKAAFALVGIGTLAEVLVPGSGPWALKTTAIVAALCFTALNLASVKGTGRLQGWMVVGLLGVLVFYIGAGLPKIAPAHYRPFFSGGLRAFMTVTGMVFVSYGGLTKVVDVAEEVKAPDRTLPLGMFLSYAVVNLLYVGVSFVTVGLLDGPALGDSLRPVQDGAAIALGSVGVICVGVGAFLAYATTGNAGILSASRSPLAMSRDGLLPAFFSRTHARFKTPYIAIMLTGTVIILTIAFLSVEDLVKTASTMLILSLAFINVSVIVMRHSRIEGYRPTYRMPLVPWLPLATLVIYGFIIAEMGVVALTTTFGFIAAASVWYIVYVQHRIDRESAAAYMVRSALSKEIQRSDLEDELVQISLERDNVVTDRFDVLVRTAVVLDLPERLTARELFHRIGEVMGPALGLTPQRMEKLLLEREREASTVVHTGVAIPHIIVEGTGIFQMALVRCREGAVFSDLQEPVHVMFVLAGSTDERNFHLRALMAIAHVVQAGDFMARWMAAPHAEQLRDIVLLSRRLRDK
ncbi:MAG: amino acid permease [Verrucomicrobia bacterium]|nr:amino acid permease [Verrucomicrobiota bacterium]MBU1908429.1 amino acid permease [Verrucomicrobiota bacterium]